MGCFPACFTSSSRRKHQKLVAVAPSTLQQHQVLETTEEAVRFEPAKLDDIIKPITESNAPREVIEEQTRIDAEKKVTCDLVEESVDEKHEETPKEIEPIVGSIGSTIVTVVPAPLSYRYENRSNSEEEDESVIDLSGSDLNRDDYGEDVDNEVQCSKQTVIQEQESSESLFSISIDSRKQVCDVEEDEKEVNSPMPKPVGSVNSSTMQHCDSVLNPIENLGQWKEVRSKALPLVSKHQEKENISIEQQYSNIPISPEPKVKLSKHCRRKPLSSNELRLVDQEIGVDTSLSSWLVECETTPKSDASDSSVGSLMCEEVSSSRSHGNRPILGAWSSDELKQLSDTSAPNQLPSPISDQISIIGTVGSYWSHTGQATDSNSSVREKENTAGKNKEDEKVKWKNTPSDERLERVLDMGILGA